MTPFPIWVVKKGMPVLSTNSRSMREVRLRLAAAPTSSRGRRAPSIFSTAWKIAFSSATGRRTRSLGKRRASRTSSAATSSGSSRCTAPGRSSSATRKASRTREEMLSPLTIWWVYLVRGRIISTTSRIWKRPCLLVLIGFWPVIISIGMPPSWA